MGVDIWKIKRFSYYVFFLKAPCLFLKETAGFLLINIRALYTLLRSPKSLPPTSEFLLVILLLLHCQVYKIFILFHNENSHSCSVSILCVYEGKQ